MAAAAALLGACSSGSDTADLDPAAVLAEAKATLDAASSVHFVLTSEEVPGGGTRLRGGEGDLVRPDTLTATVDVSISGFVADVMVRSMDGVFEAQLPLTDAFAEVDPAELGFGDPAGLLDAATGLSTLLVSSTSATIGEPTREGEEVLDTVQVELPGQLVADLLTSADPSQPVTGVVSVTQDGREVRRVRLTGPFYEADADSTFELLLTDYGAVPGGG